MDGFNENIANPYPNFNHVFDILNDIDIFSLYIGTTVTQGTYNSPIGATDKHASFSLFYNHRKSKYMFKEHRYGYIGDCIDLVRHMYSYPDNRKACMRIMYDFGVSGFRIDRDISILPSPGNINLFSKAVAPPVREVDIKVTVRSWQKHDIEYWKSHGVSKEWLKRGNVWPISHYYINGYIRYAEKYSYAYAENKDGKLTFKIYQPFSDQRRKWINNNNSSVWELWECLPDTFPILIIQKSRKDSLSIMSTMGIPSTSLQSEGTLPKPQVIQELKSRFKRIIIMYDNDFDKSTNYGKEYSDKIVALYGFEQLIIPSKYGEKDYSDLVKKYGVEKSISIIKELLK